MSIRALCLGVQDRLRAVLGDAEGKFVGYQGLGDPPPAMGQRYVTVSFAGYDWAGGDGGDTDDRRYAVRVSGFAKLDKVPTDRRAGWIAEAGTEYLLDLVDQVPGWLVHDYATLTLANGYVAGLGVTTTGFVEPFLGAAGGTVTQYSPPWADPESPPTVLRADVVVRGARRVRVDGTVS